MTTNRARARKIASFFGGAGTCATFEKFSNELEAELEAAEKRGRYIWLSRAPQ